MARKFLHGAQVLTTRAVVRKGRRMVRIKLRRKDGVVVWEEWPEARYKRQLQFGGQQ